MVRWEDDPGPASVLEYLSNGFGGISENDEAAEEHVAPFAHELLNRHGLSVDQDSRRRILLTLRDTLRDSAGVLAKRAAGDYSAVPHVVSLRRFPGGYVRDCSCNLSLRAPSLAFDFASAAIGAPGSIVRQVPRPFRNRILPAPCATVAGSW